MAEQATPCPHPAVYDRGECCGGNCRQSDLMTDDERHDATLAAVKALAMLLPPMEQGPPGSPQRTLGCAITDLERDAAARARIAADP